MPTLEATAKKQLLLHHFLAGLPLTVSHQLRVAGETTNLEEAVKRTKLLLALEEKVDATHKPAAAITERNDPAIEQLKEQMMKLTKQVAALSISGPRKGRRCFVCNSPGHLQCNYPRRQRSGVHLCYDCGPPGHIARYCPGNDRGASVKNSRCPFPQ